MPTDDYLAYSGEFKLKAKADPRLAKLAEALTASLEPHLLGKKLSSMPAAQGLGIGSVALEMIKGLAWTFTVVGAAAAIGGVICGVAFSEVPIVGTAAGVEFGVMLGGTMANAMMTGFGLIQSAQMVGYVMGSASVPLEAAMREIWANGSVTLAADQFAEAWCHIAVAVIPLLIMVALHKGSSALGSKLNAFQRLNDYVKGLPRPIINYASVKLAKVNGYGLSEFHAMKAMSMGKLIIVRGGNPDRARYVGRLLEGKGIEVKAKSLRGGPHTGCVALDAADLAKLEKAYTLHGSHTSGQPVKLSLKQGGQGEMHGWSIQKISHNGEERFLLRDPAGQPVVGDIDRLYVLQFNENGVEQGGRLPPQLTSVARMADDPAEIKWWNDTFNGITGKRRVNKDSAKHGASADFLDPKTGLAKWNADKNETLLVFSNGQAFEMNWNQMIQFVQMNGSLGMKDVFRAVTQ
jgi:hypothetical protein